MKIFSTWKCFSCGWRCEAVYPLEAAYEVMKALDDQHEKESKSCKELILKVQY